MALLSALLCDDETLDTIDDSVYSYRDSTESYELEAAQIVISDFDLAWDDTELQMLLCKVEKQQQQMEGVDCEFDEVRREAVDWMIRVCRSFGFSEVCVVLAVCYFDRFLNGVGLNKEKPWMGQLTAVACLSLAAKMEEVSVPLLADLQVEGAKYLFKSKTVQRMELLVISALKWEMSLVTPFSFLDHLIRRFCLNKLHLRFLKMCGSLVVSVIADSRSLRYRPSVLAAATILHINQKLETMDPLGFKKQLIDILKLCKEKLDECYNLVLEMSMDCNIMCKNNRLIPNSPHGVIDMSFSCENSNDSWLVSSTVSSSLETSLKRRRIQEQQMRLRLPLDWPGFS